MSMNSRNLIRRNYNGWSIHWGSPVVAERFGVTLRARTESELIAVIDNHCDKFTPQGCHKACCKDREL